MSRVYIALGVALLFGALLTACTGESIEPAPPLALPPTVAAAATATVEPAATPVPTPVPTATPAPLRIFFAPGVPAAVQQTLEQAVIRPHPAQFVTTTVGEQADIHLVVAPAGVIAPQDAVATWVYAFVAPFPTLVDSVSLTEIQNAWYGAAGVTVTLPLRMSHATRATFAAVWGEPAPGAVEVVDADALTDVLWAARPAWGIVPFEQLEPRLKVIAVDGHSLFQRNLDVETYPLALRVGLTGDPAYLAAWRALGVAALTNRDESRMTILAMTGVTALTRTTAWKMERNGILYPALKVSHWLTSSDVVHISNEVSFWEDCPPPQVTGMTFCSSPRYTELITYVHTSIVELTGNHLNDYGWQPFSYTLGIYNQLGIPYYGGGRTITEAQRAVTLTHNGNLLGFVGCNPVGPPIDWVNGLNDNRPGSAPCDDAVLQAELAGLRAQGALPIATLQYQEFYEYPPTHQQILDFRKLVDFGAAIVSGSQGHHPQGFDFYNGGFIHYGVGNLFFGDQIDPATRQTFVDRYLIYQNRLLSVELLTAQIEDYSQPRPMTAQERRLLLQKVFDASVW